MQPKQARGKINAIINFIDTMTFEKAVIVLLFIIMICMGFFFVQQQSTINALSQELGAMRALITAHPKLAASSSSSFSDNKDVSSAGKGADDGTVVE